MREQAPAEPSPRGTRDTGTQAAAFGSDSSTLPPRPRRAAGRRRCSIGRRRVVLLALGHAETAARASRSCGNPPQASTTPLRRVLTRSGAPSRSTIAPRTAPPCRRAIPSPRRDPKAARRHREPISAAGRQGRCRWSGARRARGAPADSRAQQAACDDRRPTRANFARMKCTSSMPEPIMMPNTVSSGSGGRSFAAIAELPAVERAGHDRAPAWLAARRVGMIVGEGADGSKRTAVFAREEFDHSGPFSGKRRPARCRTSRRPRGAGTCSQAPGSRRIPRFFVHRVIRDPQPAARARGRAAELRLLLGDHNLEAVRGRANRGGQTRHPIRSRARHIRRRLALPFPGTLPPPALLRHLRAILAVAESEIQAGRVVFQPRESTP